MPYAILVAAENATADPRLGRAKMKARKAANHIVRIGLLNRLSTLSKKPGRALSRLNANIIREFEVKLKRPQCHTQIMTRDIATTAPSVPNTSTNICKTGWPYGDETVLSKS